MTLILLVTCAIPPAIAEDDPVVYAQLPEAGDFVESSGEDGEVFCEPVDESEALGEVDLTAGEESVALDFAPVPAEGPGGFAAEAAPWDPETDPEQLMLQEHVAYPSGGLTNDEAISGYIDRQMHEQPGVRRRKNALAYVAGQRLKVGTSEYRLYDALYPMIQEVAKGERSSAEFTIPIRSLCDDVAYTAADLGVDSLLEGDMLSIWAVFAFWDKVNIDVGKVMDALLADLPYDLYWFDKTNGLYYSYIPYAYEDGALHIHNWASGQLTYKFSVAADYSAAKAAGTFETDRTKCASIQLAAANAQAIVDQNQALDDIGKLYAYKDAICGMVEYNYGIGDDDAYGDPWQLVWVFDGDDSTNVVCEGYSKAFQYLCDLSTFNSEISVISTIGYFYTDTGGGGRHMWNNVTIDGATYLADLTNCDGTSESHTVGYPEDLFLKGYSYKEETSYGITMYYFFCSDNRTAEYIYDDSHVELFGKDLLDYSDNVTGPDGTAVASGTFGVNGALSWTLNRSGTLYIRKADPDGSGDIPNYDETTVAPWCESDANRTLVKKVVLGAGITRLGDMAFFNCSNLRQISFNAEVSSFGTNVFTKCHMYAERSKGIIIRYCNNKAAIAYAEDLLAKKISVYSLYHSNIDMDPAVPATCTEAGLTSGYHCENCGKVLKMRTVVPAKGHKPVDDPAVAPTCTEAGLTAGSHCSVCHEVLTRQQAVAPTGHTPVDIAAVAPTCTETGLTAGVRCAVCREYLTKQQVVPATGHKPVAVAAVAPTATSTGLTEGSRCATCGAVLVPQQVVPALGSPQADPEPVAQQTDPTPATPQADPQPVAPQADPEPVTPQADPVTPQTDPEPVAPQADPQPIVVQVTKNTSKRVEKGDVIQIDTGNKKVVKIKSSNSRVAIVAEDNSILAKQAGVAKIVVTLKNNKKLTLKVRVVDPLVPKSVKLAQGKKARMKAGEKLELSAVLTPDTAQTKLKWKSSDKKIASVNKKGVVKAKKPGKVKITVTTKNKKKATITIRVVK